jgi:hypothetical protein
MLAYPRLVLGAPTGNKYRLYRASVESLFDSIARDRQANWIVDSSKSTRMNVGRFLALQKLTKYRVKGVLLVRDGRAVMWSEMKRAGSPEQERRLQGRFFNALRCALSWTVTNVLSLVAKRAASKGSVIVIRYEDLCRSPVETIREVAQFLDIPGGGAIPDAEINIQAGHTVAGNRLRFARQLKLDPDVEWISKLPGLYEKLFWVVAFPVALALGYTPGRPKEF